MKLEPLKENKIIKFLKFRIPLYLLFLLVLFFLFILTSTGRIRIFRGNGVSENIIAPNEDIVNAVSAPKKNYSHLKNEIEKYILSKKKDAEIITASVYFENLVNHEKFSINNEEKYFPGSLMKVGMMMAFLKKAEFNPSILDRVINDTIVDNSLQRQTFETGGVLFGKNYTVRELISIMISHSDNYATYLLFKLMDFESTRSVMLACGYPDPKNNLIPLTLGADDYSRMLLLLFHNSYLKKKFSDEAISMMENSVFNEGFLKQLPEGLKVAHKFGEAYKNNNEELHESGIFYLKGNPYLLTVMTRGVDPQILADKLSDISKMIYDYQVSSLIK